MVTTTRSKSHDFRRARFERQKRAAQEAAVTRREEAMTQASQGDHSAPIWAQVRQCYIEYRPMQIRMQRKMMRCGKQ